MGARPIQRVLVVDDDARITRAFCAAINRIGITVLPAASSDIAIDLARRHQPDLAIVDLQLGHESGLDLVRALRVIDARMLLVMISAYGSIDVAVRAVKAGADEVFEKPITPREILARLGRGDEVAIETPSADRALWEHVHRVLGDCTGNKSEAARRLQRPRSWLRRFLARSAPS